MAYLNLDVDFFTHPKTLRLVAILGDGAIACLLRLWSYTAKHYTESGILSGMTACELESIIGWRGESGVLMLTLTNLGFIDVVSNNCRIHGWKEHAGHLVSFKKRAKSAAYTRWRRYATSMQQALLSDESSNAQKQITNAPNLSYPNLSYPTKTKEEEKIRSASEKPQRIATDEDFFESLKTNPAYQHINLPVEIGKMDAWLSLPKNKHRKKTRQFVLNWLNKIDRPIAANGAPSQKCQERVQRGNFLKPCNESSVTVMNGRPLCQEHKEHHERKSHLVAT